MIYTTIKTDEIASIPSNSFKSIDNILSWTESLVPFDPIPRLPTIASTSSMNTTAGELALAF